MVIKINNKINDDTKYSDQKNNKNVLGRELLEMNGLNPEKLEV